MGVFLWVTWSDEPLFCTGQTDTVDWTAIEIFFKRRRKLAIRNIKITHGPSLLSLGLLFAVCLLTAI